MTPATHSPPAAADPVRDAVADPGVQAGLLTHALAVLGRRSAGRPRSAREDGAQDAVQEACERALARAVDYNPAFGTVTAWLHGFLDRTLLSLGRQTRRQPAQQPDDWDEAAADPRLVGGETAADRLDAATVLGRLAAEHRAVLELRLVQGLDHASIAARLGISEGNARVKLCRALTAARALVGEVTP